MKRYTTTSVQQPKKATASSGELRQELDVAIKHITQHINKDPKKAAIVLEGWVNRAAPEHKKKRAA